MRTIIFITGVTTVGKSTLTHILGSKLFEPRNYIIPLATTRTVREDDDSKYIINLDAKKYEESNFFIKHGQYGILSSEIDKFLKSHIHLAVCICGPKELGQLLNKKTFSFTTLKVLIKYSETEEEENILLEKNINLHFKGKIAEDRLNISKQLNRDYFFNKQYLIDNIDIILTHKLDIKDWVKIISDKIGYMNLQDESLHKKIVKYCQVR